MRFELDRAREALNARHRPTANHPSQRANVRL
jgi:hypothetical protein